MEMLKLMMDTSDYMASLTGMNNNNNNNDIIKKDLQRSPSPEYRVPPINLDELPEVLLCKWIFFWKQCKYYKKNI